MRALVTGLTLAFLALLAIFYGYCELNTCSMSWMYPIYHDIPVTSQYSKAGTKYKLRLYREGGSSIEYSGPQNLGGTPVVFLPGNAGSYSQGRSIAARAARANRSDDLEFDFFLVHFDEDLTAMHGATLLDQAVYVNDVIPQILALYKDHQSPPTSVIIIGHSMGGVVARTLLTLPNYENESVKAIFTLSAPHAVPPITFDRDITAVYDLVNQWWRRNQATIADVSVVSIAGGHSDFMVLSDYAAVDSVFNEPELHSLTLYSYSIPGVDRGADHLAIIWCAEVRDAIVDSLIAVSNASLPSRVLPIKSRMEALRNRLTSPLDVDWERGVDSSGIHGNATGLKLNIFDILFGWRYDVKNLTQIEVPLTTSIVALNVNVNEGSQFRHWAPASPHDSRWYNESGTVLWSSAGPFVPYRTREHLRIQTVNASSVSVRIAWIPTLANVAMHYRTLLLVYPVAILCWCFAYQLRRGGCNLSEALDVFEKTMVWRVGFALALVHVALASSTVRAAVRRFQMPSESENVASLASVGYQVHDILIGTPDILLAWVPAALLLVSLASIRVLDLALSIVAALNSKRPHIHVIDQLPIAVSASVGGIVAAFLLFLIPYQVMLVFLALLQLLRTRSVKGCAYTWLHLMVWVAIIDAPLIVVWIRNLNWHWTLAFSTWRNLASAAPTAALVAVVRSLRLGEGRFLVFTLLVLGYIGTYALLFGAMHCFMLHNFVNYLAAWLLIASL